MKWGGCAAIGARMRPRRELQPLAVKAVDGGSSYVMVVLKRTLVLTDNRYLCLASNAEARYNAFWVAALSPRFATRAGQPLRTSSSPES